MMARHKTEEPSMAEENGELRVDAQAELPAPTAEEELAANGGEQPEGGGPAAQTEIELLKAERDQLLDRLARLQAEFENARKRAERERNEQRDYATGNVVEQFLPVVDNFELALMGGGTAEQMPHGV